jgi:hypothetical protein
MDISLFRLNAWKVQDILYVLCFVKKESISDEQTKKSQHAELLVICTTMNNEVLVALNNGSLFREGTALPK